MFFDLVIERTTRKNNSMARKHNQLMKKQWQ